ncbi:hypothetical protein M9Y10_006303 [Tritrichomonas musculus]|uniref:Bromo domain-containing protein n=1 Tax=Tritrichomonas musculus TaxID=1915356 RepID=A0ABR2JGF1_9EUKA
MTKPFSLLHVILGEEDTNSAEDFQFRVDQWKKINRSKRYSSRKNQTIQFCPDQQQLPYTREKNNSLTEDETEEAEPFQASIETKENQANNPPSTSIGTSSSKITTYDEKFDFPPFSLINQHNFPLLQLRPRQQQIPPQQNQRQMMIQSQQQIQQRNLINRQNSMSSFYSQRGISHSNLSQINANNASLNANSRSVGIGGYQSNQNYYGKPQMGGIGRPGQLLSSSPSSPSLNSALSALQSGQIQRQMGQGQAQLAQNQNTRIEDGSQNLKNESFFIDSRIERIYKQRERTNSEAQFIGTKAMAQRQQPLQSSFASQATSNLSIARSGAALNQNNMKVGPQSGIIDQKISPPSITNSSEPTSTPNQISVTPSTPTGTPNTPTSTVIARPTDTTPMASPRGPLSSSASLTSLTQPNSILQQQRQLQLQRSNTQGTGGYNGYQPTSGFLQNSASTVNFSSQGSLLSLAQQQQLQRSQQLQYQQQQQQQQRLRQQQIHRIYFNQYAENALWSVMWDPEACTNVPLILDRSDRSIKFTEVNSHGGNDRRKLKTWSDMNFENSTYYTELFVSKSSRLNLNLRHSDPALNLSLIEPNMQDPENFHHPKFDPTQFINRKLRVTYKPEYDIGENGEAAISPFLKDLRSLSGRRGGVIVVEHTSEALPFIMNVGMASRLIIYWHKEKPTDFPKINDEKLQILEPDQTSPFIAQIPRNEPVPSINCLLYSVPVAEHRVESTDFLLIKSIKKPIFYIKKFKSIYCAGFLEAHHVVMRPSTKEMQDFQLLFIKALLINIFRGTEQYPGRRKIQVSQLQQEFFPGVNEPKLRQVLRCLAKYKRKQGNVYWKRKDLESLNKQFASLEITPELVCKYQSMLVGLHKLRKNGVNIITRSKRVFQQIQNLHGELTKKVACKIEAELMKTPWARTENFNKAFQGHAVQIEHADDGSQIMRSKSRRRKGEHISIDGKEQPEITKPKLAGTDKDLRSLTLRELREKLMASGVQPQLIDEMSRWKQVDLLRKVANRQKEDGNKSELAQNYSRGPRNDYAASLDQYKKQYQQTFETNLSFINTQNAIDNDELLDDGNILDDISLQMTRDAQDDEDNEDLFELQEEMNQPTIHGSDGDPPELIPYGIYTYPTRIDWEKFGFANTTMRTVAKLITVSWNRIDGLHVELHWKRSPPQIEALMKNPNVYQDQGQKAPMSSEDLEEYILKNQRKTLQDKIRRTKQAIHNKGSKTMVQSYLTVRQQLPLINDRDGANNLTFHLTPEIMQKISEASERFALFEAKNGKSHSKKKKSGHGIHGSSSHIGGLSSIGSSSVNNDHNSRDGHHNNNNSESEYDSDDSPEITVIAPHRRIGRQSPVVVFNELLKKLLAKLLQKPGDEYWPFKKPVLKKDVPDYHNYVTNPMCFEDVERKANNLEYTTISKFYSDVKQIETNCQIYNTGRNEELVALANKMMNEFENELRTMRDELDQRENEIDPVLRQFHD